MNKHIDQSEFSKIIAERKGIDQKIVDAFVKQLFEAIENRLLTESSVKIDELGVFRLIQSGSTKRILFLGNTGKPVAKTKVSGEISTIVAPVKSEDKPRAAISFEKQDKKTDAVAKSSVEEKQVVVSQAEKIVPEKTIDASPVAPIIEVDNNVGVSEEKKAVSHNKDSKNVLVSDSLSSSDEAKTEHTLEKPPVPNNSIPEAVVKTPEVDKKPEQRNAPTTTAAVSSASRDIPAQRPVTRPAVQSRNHYQNDRYNQAPKKSKLPIYTGIVAIALLILGVVVYNLVTPSSRPSTSVEKVKEASVKERSTLFAEVANNDPENLSCVILIDENVTLANIAKLYYGNELFWPFVFKANRNVVDSNLVLQANTIVKIPKINVDLVDYTTGALNNKLEAMVSEIRKDLSLSEQ